MDPDGGIVKGKADDDVKESIPRSSSSLDESEEMERDRAIRRKVIWILLILAITGGFSYHVSYLGGNYAAYHTFSDVTNEAVNITRPQLMICFPGYMSNFHYSIGGTYNWDGQIPVPNVTMTYRDDIVNKNMFNLWKLIYFNTTTVIEPPFLKFSQTMRAMKLSFMKEIRTSTAGALNTDFIFLCVLNGYYCRPSNFSTHYFGYNTCFRFNPEHVKPANLSETGLMLSVNAGLNMFPKFDPDYVFDMQATRMYIQQPNQWPSLDHPQASIEPLMYGTIKVTSVSKKRINKPHSLCHPTKKVKACGYVRLHGIICEEKHDTYELCIQLAAQEDLVKHCKCITTARAIPEHLTDLPLCHDIPTIAYMNKGVTWNNITSKWVITAFNDTEIPIDSFMNMTEVYERSLCFFSRKKFWGSIGQSSCTLPCDDIENKISMNKVPNPLSERDLMTKISKLYGDSMTLAYIDALNFSHPIRMLKIYAEYISKGLTTMQPFKMTTLKIAWNQTKGNLDDETLRYGLVNLFSDIGGTLGLWAGASFITFLQLADSLYGLIQRYRHRKRK